MKVKINTGYKLFEQKGEQLSPLFIDKKEPTPMKKWVKAKIVPTKTYAVRPGWHVGTIPDAPWFKCENGTYKSRFAHGQRVWCEVEYDATIDYQPQVEKLKTKCFQNRIPRNGYYIFRECGKGDWIITGRIRVKRILTEEERQGILESIGYDEQAMFESYAKRFQKKRMKK